ncbi:hypothetical protein [Streptomyces carminius]|nr:hypothetical protein [Streptomyces carminius]
MHIDTVHGPAFVDSPTPPANYRTVLGMMEGFVLPPEKSRDFMWSIAREM